MPDEPSTPDSSTANPRCDRGPAGRFAPGNRLSKGNVNNRRMQQLRNELLDSATGDVVKGIGKKLALLALQGDVTATKVYLDHIIGRPMQSVALTGPDGEALGLDWPAVQSAIMGALAGFPEARLAVAMQLTRIADDARGAGSTGDGA